MFLSKISKIRRHLTKLSQIERVTFFLRYTVEFLKWGVWLHAPRSVNWNDGIPRAVVELVLKCMSFFVKIVISAIFTYK